MQTNDRLLDPMLFGSRPPVGFRREQIVLAAAELFSVRGYHGTSMADIGERVGLLKGSLYAHVSSKEEVLQEIVSTASRHFLAALETIARCQEPAPAKLRLALRAHLRVLVDHGHLARVFLQEAHHLKGQPARWVGEARARYEALWQGIFQQGIGEGSFRPECEPCLATLLALSACSGSYPWPERQMSSDADSLADRICNLLLSGLLMYDLAAVDRAEEQIVRSGRRQA